MNTNRNAVTPFLRGTPEELANAIGITQFHSGTSWSHTVGGLLIQGGRANGVTHPGPFNVPFSVGYPTQVLGVFPQEIGTNAHTFSVDGVTLASFDIYLSSGPAKDFYWFAIGV